MLHYSLILPPKRFPTYYLEKSNKGGIIYAIFKWHIDRIVLSFSFTNILQK